MDAVTDLCSKDPLQNGQNPCAISSGAVYVFERPLTGGWAVWATYNSKVITYLKAPNADVNDRFGFDLSLSGDGGVLVVGAHFEDNVANSSLATGTADLCSDGSLGCTINSGAVYIFERPTSGSWSAWAASNNKKITYLKAPNAGVDDLFGGSLSISSNGSMLAVGSPQEDNAANGTMNSSTQCVNSGPLCSIDSGAVYVFERPTIGGWSGWANNHYTTNLAYLKAPNAGPNDLFGVSVSLNNDGGVLAVGATQEDNTSDGTMDATFQCIDAGSLCATDSGAAYVFRRPQSTGWSDWASSNNNRITYLKAPNASAGDWFGRRISISGDGRALAVGAPIESSDLQYNSSTPISSVPTETINGVEKPIVNDNFLSAGAVYLY